MNVEELKLEIENKTGIPALLLSGETSEEVISRAKALVAFRRDTQEEQPKSASAQFAKWMKATEGIEEPSEAMTALCILDQIAERERLASGGYPYLSDGGNPYVNGATAPDPRSTEQLFENWFNNICAYDPTKKCDGWKPL